jgi:hypothetical protein
MVMTERWQREMVKLHRAELPPDLWERIAEGPRLQPLPARGPSRVIAATTALVLFLAAAALLWIVFTPFRTTVRTLAGSDILVVPARGETSPMFLADGRPVFVVHHKDGTVSVVDSFSSHRAWGFEEPVEWCPTTRQFVEWAHEAHYDEYGRWESAGPAPSGLATFAFQVVGRDAAGDPAAIRVGAMQAPDPAGSAPITDPSRPPFCPGAEPVTFTIDAAQVWDSPAEAVAAQPYGWIAVRGTLSVASDGFVQLCSQLDRERCKDAAVVRGIDGVGLMVNVLRPYPNGTGYEKPRVWLAQVRGGVLDDLAIGDIRTTG